MEAGGCLVVVRHWSLAALKCIKPNLFSGVLWHLASSQLSSAEQGGPAGSFCSTPQCASCVDISACIPPAPHTKDLKQCLSQSSQSAPSEITSGEHTCHHSSQWPTSVEHHQALNRIEKGVIEEWKEEPCVIPKPSTVCRKRKCLVRLQLTNCCQEIWLGNSLDH